MTQIDKAQLFQQVISGLEEKLALLVESAFEAKEASTNEESKAENKYDTRGLEASYLASGQAKRAQALQEQIYQLKKVNLRAFQKNEPINISALVELEVNEEVKKFVFLLPIGGVEINIGGIKIQTITLEAPLGQNLFGQVQGNDFDLNGQFYEILKVQ